MCPNIAEFNPKELVFYYLKYILEFVIPLSKYLGVENIAVDKISNISFVFSEHCNDGLAGGAYNPKDNSISFASRNFLQISYEAFFHEMSRCLGIDSEYVTQWLTYKFAGGRKGYYVEEDYEFMCQLEGIVGFRIILLAYLKNDTSLIKNALFLAKMNILDRIDISKIDDFIRLLTQSNSYSWDELFTMLEQRGYLDIIPNESELKKYFSEYETFSSNFEDYENHLNNVIFYAKKRRICRRALSLLPDSEACKDKEESLTNSIKEELGSAQEFLGEIPFRTFNNSFNGQTIITYSNGRSEFVSELVPTKKI